MPNVAERIDFYELDNDQRREMVNTAQRYGSWREALRKARGFRGSLVWHESGGGTYLVRSYYNSAGARHQKIEGPRSPETEQIKARWEEDRARAQAREKDLKTALARQAGINRVLHLGRVPLLGAKIIRALDDADLLGQGLKIVGTNALYAYEAAAGVRFDPGITSTQDIDLLMDARRRLRMAADADIPEGTLMALLRRIDKSFARERQHFRAGNQDGYLVDLITPQVNPPWREASPGISSSADDLSAVPIEGLAWLENAPSFEALAIDEKGAPVRMVVVDPRVFAAHKHWLSTRADRDPLKRRRDAAQARATAQLVARYLTHLPYEADALRMMPLAVFNAARSLFDPGADAA